MQQTKQQFVERICIETRPLVENVHLAVGWLATYTSKVSAKGAAYGIPSPRRKYTTLEKRSAPWLAVDVPVSASSSRSFFYVLLFSYDHFMWWCRKVAGMTSTCVIHDLWVVIGMQNASSPSGNAAQCTNGDIKDS